jgi:glucose/arabinose dehydrogenase
MEPQTNTLWVGDVGWDTAEEIDRVTPGKLHDFGWPCFEGVKPQHAYRDNTLSTCTKLYAHRNRVTKPVFQYNHGQHVVKNDGCARGSGVISALAFERGPRLPRRYQHALFFADYVRGCIFAMRPGRSQQPDPKRIGVVARHAGTPVGMTVGPDGSLYYLDYYGHRIVRIS